MKNCSFLSLLLVSVIFFDILKIYSIYNWKTKRKLKNKKKLKNIENRKTETKKKKQEEKEANLTFNMADALKTALNDRRKYTADSKSGTIGAPKLTKQESILETHSKNTLLDKITSVVQPKSDNENSSDENNSDWE